MVPRSTLGASAPDERSLDVKSRLTAALRPALAELLWPVVRPFRKRMEVSRDGMVLRPGITALVAARNEAYTIPFCLRSLVGFADQIVCVDNGSEDETLSRMRQFQSEYGDRVEVETLSLPGALLGECREAGLAMTRYQWHLRWDADMVAKTSGPESMIPLREHALRDDRPRAIQLPRTNLFGDLHHALAHLPIVDPGEPILVRFDREVRYREYGKFDVIRLPLYFRQTRESPRYYFHLQGLKSDVNLLHRFHYFEWRRIVNSARGSGSDRALDDFEAFKQRRNLELFGTTDPLSVRFRFNRQLMHVLVRFDPDRYGSYPEVLADELRSEQRFEVLYRNGRPFQRLDREDPEMTRYQPTKEDMVWSPEAFLRRLLTPSQAARIGLSL
jgi:glycosyltransferase involved in cell wall biosynthesis